MIGASKDKGWFNLERVGIVLPHLPKGYPAITYRWWMRLGRLEICWLNSEAVQQQIADEAFPE